MSSSSDWRYDVFTSFSGEDIRKTFLSHLYAALERKLITTFKDNEIVRSRCIGPELLNAIQGSKISIVVFSKNYASSTWCLNELLEIVRCNEESGLILIPVFHDVDPSHVRKQTGDFGEAFEITCRDKLEKERQQWRRALIHVANMAGEDSRNWDNEAKMIEKIVSDVSNKLNFTQSRDFDDLVGIQDHMSKMNSLLCLESEEVRMVGIWGPSGIGKSTIARALFSQISPLFQRSVFIDRASIDKNMENNRLVNLCDYGTQLHLHKQLLSQILDHKDIRIDHLGVLGERLEYKRVLIVLDDVDDRFLLSALAGQTKWFGSGSRIVVITKDKKLLRTHGIAIIYEVDFPSEEQALQIFYRSAFQHSSPPDSFKEFSTQVVKLAGKLPLGLNVLGSSLRGMDKEDWEDMQPRLKSCLDGEINNTFRLSYDRLNEKDKAIFRHVACLFNHDTYEYVTRLLKDSKLDVNVGLKNLADKSLIHISKDGIIRMHHLLQGMGREVVCGPFIHEPGKRQFLMDAKDIYDVLVDDTGTESVLGISLNTSEMDETLTISERAFKKMKNLRFLRFFRGLFGNKQVKLHLQGGSHNLWRQLRLLEWCTYPMKCLPSNFRPENLVELRMWDSKLEKLWEGVQPLKSLKKMDLWGSENLKQISDLSLATNLVELNLNFCSSLVNLPSSIQNLNKLRELNMEGCTKLEVLPGGINLESLDHLDLSGCTQLSSFPDVSTSISELHLDRTAIEEVPWWIENITGLAYLNMNGCNKLKYVSPNICKLKHLEEVYLSDCGAWMKDNWLIHPNFAPTSLRALDLSDNTFKRLPDLWTSIQPQCLILSNCRKLVSLPEFPLSLKYLRSDNCEALESVSGPFQDPEIVLNFINCFKLDQEVLIQQSVFRYLILPSRIVPAYFTNRATGSSMTIRLHQSSITEKFLEFKACIVIEADTTERERFYDAIRVCSTFRGSDCYHYESLERLILPFWTRMKDHHLIMFHCRFPLKKENNPFAYMNYDEVDVNFHCDSELRITGCGIRLSNFCPSSISKRKKKEISVHLHVNSSCD